MGGVFGNRSENVGSGLLVESVLFGKRVYKLGEDFVRNNGFCKFIRVVSQSSESQSSRLLD
jgi:hypothetical protein